MLLKCFLCVVFVTGAFQVRGQCPTESELIEQFNNVADEHDLYRKEGETCIIRDEENHDEADGHDKLHHTQESGNDSDSCETIYNVCRTIILDLNLSTEECLSAHGHDNTTASTVTPAQAYGYGFLMILFVSLCSLGGICLVPLIKSNSSTGKRVYEHIYSFMVAIAVSALVSDATLHLIPHAFGLHDHEDDSHSEDENIDFIWKGCVVLSGLYGFYLLEFFLHTCGHDHMASTKDGERCDGNHLRCPADDVHFTSALPTAKDDKDKEKQTNMVLLSKSSKSEQSNDDSFETDVDHHHHNHQTICIHPKKVKPVAWLIIIGDAVHNVADGIALGAAISQNLSLGVSTMFALVFHEVPHEFGDFVILVKSGFHWGMALFINFLQSLGAVLGFFIGVAVSADSTASSNWILAITAGLFFYIALTDLLPELVHGGGHGQTNVPRLVGGSCNLDWIVRFILVNVGFFLAFGILLVLAIFEEDLNSLI